MKRITKKRATAILAVITLIVAMLGAAFAWRDYAQHKTNEFSGKGYRHDVRLVEDFEEEDDWRIDDGPIKKEIFVANVGKAVDGYGAVIVRLQLKEYMEIGKLEYTMTDKRYMIDTDGQFVVYQTDTAAQSAWPGHNVANLTDVVTGKTGWFIETKEKDPNGQYGKYVVTDITVDMNTATPVIPGSTRASDDAKDKHHDPDNGECLYPLHLWDEGSELPTAQYISWILGADVMPLSEWNALPAGQKILTKIWVYDDVYETGWVYWMDFLNPEETTSNFLEKVELIKQPDGPFYYAIHTDMEAVSLDELGLWDDMPTNLFDLFKPAESGITLNPAGNRSIFVGAIEDLPQATVLPAGASQVVTWESSNQAVVTVNGTTGKFNGVAVGTATLTATAQNGARASFRVTVTNDPWELSKDRLRKAIEDGEAITLVTAERDKYQDAGIGVLESAIAEGKPLLPLDKNQVTQQQLDDAAKKIEDAIKALILKDQTVLPIKPGQPFSPRIDEEELQNDFRGYLDGDIKRDFRSLYIYLTASPLGGNPGIYWQLEDILDDSITDYTGITVATVDNKFAGAFTIGQDREGRASIICTYLPTLEDYAAQVPVDSQTHPVLTTQITLTQGTKSATFGVTMIYQGVLWWDD